MMLASCLTDYPAGVGTLGPLIKKICLPWFVDGDLGDGGLCITEAPPFFVAQKPHMGHSKTEEDPIKGSQSAQSKVVRGLKASWDAFRMAAGRRWRRPQASQDGGVHACTVEAAGAHIGGPVGTNLGAMCLLLCAPPAYPPWVSWLTHF